MRPDMLCYQSRQTSRGDLGKVRSGDGSWGEESERAYMSGSFCVSITAAMGMPKLETGPQKSAESEVGQSVIRSCFGAVEA